MDLTELKAAVARLKGRHYDIKKAFELLIEILETPPQEG